MSTQPQTTDDLRAAAIAAEAEPAAAPVTEPQYTELDGIKVGKTQDGKFEAILPTGARYVGDSETQLALNIAKGKVEADKTIKQYKDSQPAPAPVAAQPSEEELAQQILLDHVAKALKFTDGNELRDYVSQTGKMTQEQRNMEVAAGFQQLCPDFPESETNNETLLDIAQQNGFPFSPMGLRAAHMIAVAENKYKPLTPEQIRAQKFDALGIKPEEIMPPSPAPMLPGQGAASPQTAYNPWDRKATSLEQLRQVAMEAERG